MQQYFLFEDDRTGTTDIPSAGSGYTILFDVHLDETDNNWHITITKKGANLRQTTAGMTDPKIGVMADRAFLRG